MALELKQQLRVSQQLVMTPQLQQAIKLLQLSSLDLLNVVEQEMVENPVLEESPEDEAPEGSAEEATEREAAEASAAAEQPEPERADEETREPTADEMVGDVDWENYMESRPQTSLSRPDDERPSLEDNLTPRTSLADHMRWQIGFIEWSAAEREVALMIVGNLTDDGYLDEELETIARAVEVELELAEAVLRRVQELDPVGVAARDLSECLRIQARVARVDDKLTVAIIDNHLDLLQRKDYRAIARIEGVEIDDICRSAALIGALEPRPGRQFAEEEPIYITPDIFVHKVGDDYHVVLNEDGLPKLRVSPTYRAVLSRKDGSKETREYVREKLRSAVWLIKSIHQRQRTIMKVMQSILRFQRPFFDRGVEALRPLNLRDVAEDIGMHESTVSRVTTNKYVQTPHGILELKYFFSSSIQTDDGESIASESVKEKIREIIRKENPKRPLSDQRIAELLRGTRINIARRTVTKYREALRILSSTRRRQIG